MNTQKKFDMVSIVILTLLVSSEAILKAAADLSLGIPVLGEIAFPLADVYTFIVWSIVIIWFVFKMGGWGKAKGLYLTIGGLSSLVGIPIGLAGGVAFAVYLANHPKVLAVAEVVAAPEAGGTGELGAAAEAGEAAKVATGAEQAGTAAKGASATGEATESAAARGGTGGKTEAGTESGQEEASKPGSNVEPGAFGERAEPMEELQQRLTGENPVGEETGAPQEEPSQDSGQSDKKTDLEKEQAAKEARAEKIRKLIEKLPQGQAQPTPQEEQQQNDDDLAATAGYR